MVWCITVWCTAILCLFTEGAWRCWFWVILCYTIHISIFWLQLVPIALAGVVQDCGGGDDLWHIL